MTTLTQLAQIADDVYEGADSDGRDLALARCAASFSKNVRTGFQGAVYESGENTIVAIRGTASTGGFTADLKIFARVKPKQYDDAATLFDWGLAHHARAGTRGELIVVGHSLGGYLAQAVCTVNQTRGCVFNAPGARSLFTGRLFGKGAYFSDRNLDWADQNILNVNLMGDPVSSRMAGKRIGRKIHLTSDAGHSQTWMKQAVALSRYRDMDLDEALDAAQAARGNSMMPIAAFR